MRTRQYPNIFTDLVCILIGILFCIGSTKFGDIRHGVLSPGFYPFVVGTLFIMISFIDFLSAMKKVEGREKKKLFMHEDSWRKILFLIVALFIYSLVLDTLGSLLATFAFVFVVVTFMAPQKWRTALIISFLVTAVSFTVFDVMLGVQFPGGVLDLYKIRKWVLR